MTLENEYHYIDEYRDTIIDLLKKQGLNLVTIPKGRGKALSTNWPRWSQEQFDYSIPNDCDFAVMGGITSDNLAIADFEIRGVLDEQREAVLLSIMEEIFPNAKNETLVVKTGNGYHVYFKTSDHVLRSKDFAKYGITVELKGQGKYVVGPSSKHYDQDKEGNYFLSGKVYKIISNTTQIKTVSGESFVQNLLDSGWKSGSDEKKVSELWKELSKKVEGSNRQIDMIRILTSLKIKNPEFEYRDLEYHGYNINSKFKDPYPKKLVDEKIKSSWDFAVDILENKIGKILHDDEIFSKIWDERPSKEKVDKNATSLVKVCIKNGLIVVKSELRRKLLEWCTLHQVRPLDDNHLENAVSKIINGIFSDSDMVKEINKICFNLGQMKKPIIFDKDQVAQAGEWLKGRHHIKKFELAGDLIHFNERHYEKDSKEFIIRQASESLVNHTNNSCNEVLGHIERTAPMIKGDDIERHAHLKCLNNGVYNIKTGEFTEGFDPAYIILNLIPREFDENAKFKTISKRVNEIIVEDKDRQTFFDFSSTCLHPYTGIDLQLGLVGIPGTGKSQLGKLLKKSFGEKNVNYATIHDIAKDMTLQQDVAYYFLNIDEDLSPEDIKRLDVIKKWVSQNNFTGRSIYAHSSTYRPSSRLMFMANGMFEITNPDDAEAIYERSHLLKINQKFRDTSKEKKNIFESIMDKEFNGFITFLLKNATDVFKNQKIKYSQKTIVTETIWNEYGNNIRKFIDTWIEKGVENRNEKNEIWSKWLGVAIDKKFPPKGRNQFYAKFEEIIGTSSVQIKDGDSKYWGYLGLRLKTDDEVAEQEKINETRIGRILKNIQRLGEDDPRLKEVEEVIK